MIMFRKDLKNNVKKEFMRYDEKTNNLRILIEAAIELDDKLYELIMKKRYNNSKNKIEFYTRSASYRNEKRRINERRDDDYETISMKLDSTQRRTRINFKRKQNKKKTCYSCDKSSHFAKDCRSKNMIKREQLNATLKVESDDWEHVEHAEMKNIAKESKSSKISAENEYFHVKIRKKLLAVLDEKKSNETSAFTQRINQIIRTQIERRSFTSYVMK